MSDLKEEQPARKLSALNKREKTEVAIETTADPASIINFNGGNTIANSMANMGATGFSVLSGIASMYVRAATELRKRGVKAPLPKFMQKNPGAALTTNGVLLTGAGIIAGTDVDFSLIDISEIDWSNISGSLPGEAVPMTLSVLFGTGNIAQGIGIGLKDGSLGQNLTNLYGQVAYPTALIIAAGDAPLPIKATFAAAAVTGIICSATNRKTLAGIGPNMLNAAGCFMSAAYVDITELVAANVMWGAGYASLHLTQIYGGVVGTAQAINSAVQLPEIDDLEVVNAINGPSKIRNGILYIGTDISLKNGETAYKWSDEELEDAELAHNPDLLDFIPKMAQ